MPLWLSKCHMKQTSLAIAVIALSAVGALVHPGDERSEPARAARPYSVMISQMARDGTNPTSQGSFSTSATATKGAAIEVRAEVRSADALYTLIDVEVLAPNGVRVAQEYFDNTLFGRGQTQSFVVRWTPPPNALPGEYVVKVGVFQPGQYWGALYHWNDRAGAFRLP